MEIKIEQLIKIISMKKISQKVKKNTEKILQNLYFQVISLKEHLIQIL